MIIDFKYHIASLVAVFLALGIGILVGSTMLGNDTIIETQKQITNNLEQQLKILREKNDASELKIKTLESKNDALKDFDKQVLPLLVNNRLVGKKIAIVITNNAILPDKLKNIFHLAGAEVTSVTTILNAFDVSKDKAIPPVLNVNPNMDQHKFLQIVSRQVAVGILTNEDQQVISGLSQKGFIKIDGTYGVPLDAVVLVGGSRSEKTIKVEDIDYSIIDYFLSSKVDVFGVEDTDTQYSYMKDYQKKGISTVDNIESAPGQLALIMAMQGNPGHYGTKETAEKLLPPTGVVAENASR